MLTLVFCSRQPIPNRQKKEPPFPDGSRDMGMYCLFSNDFDIDLGLDLFVVIDLGGESFRGVGMVRAKANIALTNLVYNMCRLVQIKKYQPNLIATQ